MPVSLWEEVIGYSCSDCGGAATHWYGGMPLCCDCHAGEGQGLTMRHDAEVKNPLPRSANGSVPRKSMGAKVAAVTKKYRESHRVYYIYRRHDERGELVFVTGTDHKQTAKLRVAQKEALGWHLVVYCSQPKRYCSRCVYSTPVSEAASV